MQEDRTAEVLEKILSMFESGDLPAAVARTVIQAQGGTRPSDRWSLANRLIMFAYGTADARGYRQWQEVGRQVKKGAKAFYILAPVTKKVTARAIDEETGEEREETRIVTVGFRDVPVFRYEDTEGDPVEEPDYAPPEPPPLLEAAERFGVKVAWTPFVGPAYGRYHSGTNKMELMSHDTDIFFHELAHAAHNRIRPLQGGQHPDQEIVAEVAAAALCEMYGCRGHLRFAWEYVRGYAGQDAKSALRAVMGLLGEIDAVLRLILEPAGESGRAA